MGQSLPERESMAAGNCKGRELEDQSSPAWGAVKRFAQWGYRASIRARNSLRFLGGLRLSQSLNLTPRFPQTSNFSTPPGGSGGTYAHVQIEIPRPNVRCTGATRGRFEQGFDSGKDGNRGQLGWVVTACS